MDPIRDGSKRVTRLSEVISDSRVREIFLHCMKSVDSLHADVTASVSDLEVRFFFRDEQIVRIVPYHSLLHVQVGGEPGWEVRVRESRGYLETLDMIVHRFLRICAGRSAAA